MNASPQIIGFLIVVAMLGTFLFFEKANKEGLGVSAIPSSVQSREEQKGSVFDPKNATYMIDGEAVTLVNGVSEKEAAPGSASKIMARYFGNEVRGDLNGDGREDIAYLITQDGGGSGLFYYAVVALGTEGGYTLTNAFLIGDRIAPQANHINSSARELYINYAERKPGEPMTAQPSQGATLYLKVTPEGVLEGLMK